MSEITVDRSAALVLRGGRGVARRPCLVCGRPTAGTRCRRHQAELDAERDARRGNAAARGYGHAHRRRRAELLPAAIGRPCPLCLQPMLEGQALELHHSLPLVVDRASVGDAIVHAGCNARAGATTRRKR